MSNQGVQMFLPTTKFKLGLENFNIFPNEDGDRPKPRNQFRVRQPAPGNVEDPPQLQAVFHQISL